MAYRPEGCMGSREQGWPLCGAWAGCWAGAACAEQAWRLMVLKVVGVGPEEAETVLTV